MLFTSPKIASEVGLEVLSSEPNYSERIASIGSSFAARAAG